jgi:hypothetical protein
VEDDVMTIEFKPMVIEISEEAYKQNSVYRPWPMIRASNAGNNLTRLPLGQLHVVKGALKVVPR